MKKYSLETKLEAVNVYLNGAESLRTVAKRFNISKSMLCRWAAKYQEHGISAFQERCTKYSI
ncbi:transposase, partial [Bacillus litorisediminis]|uniref:transposase n=1 Tax=Bacillus litorisediminis TaxID=2922713 RepID=UPI001FAEF6CA